MSRKTIKTSDGEAEPIAKVCANCSGWKPLGMDKFFGHCLRVKNLPAPPITTDLASCSRYEPFVS